MTYSELGRQSNAIACFLREFVTGECVVAILLPRRSEHLYIAQLGALKSGAAFTCIDPAFPDEQVRNILHDAEAVVLLTDDAGNSRAANCGYSPDRVFDVAALLSRPHSAALPLATREWLTPDSLAYIIYTSGTTGRPKGVMIEHRSIANLVASDIEEFKLSPPDRVGQSSSSAYDSSVEETWLALAAGAAVVVIDEETTRLGPDLAGWLRRERVTALCPPPTLLRTLGCDAAAKKLPDLSLLYVGGEPLPRDVAGAWSRGRRMVNGYGPTECTVTCMRADIREGEPVAIGRPVANVRAWVLNESLEEVADGEKGELFLGGACLARGYHNQPETTAQKFLAHPRLGRIYRTGDLVHREPDGAFFYHGRIDSQVKLRGYRVELEAIESRLSECDGVREAACTIQQNNGRQALVAFVVPEDSRELSFDDLKASLRKVLPEYMIPNRIAALEKLPETIGGKLNRQALPVLGLSSRQNGDRQAAPRTRLEERIEAAYRAILSISGSISVHDDFFNDLGGTSLQAAELISMLRDDPLTASITARDLYEARTAEALALRAHPNGAGEFDFERDAVKQKGSPIAATTLQVLWLLAGLIVVSAAGCFAAFDFLPWLLSGAGLTASFAIAPFILFAAIAIYAPLSILIAVLVKKTLIGRYRPLRAPVWGSFYVRHWMVQQTARTIPWRLLSGTVFQIAALRMLGARIGNRVHIHRGVDLVQGGWDLLEIGDDVTLSQDASIRLVDLDGGDVVVAPVILGSGSTLEVRAGVGGHTRLEPGAYLTASSFLQEGERIPGGERWDGIPAKPAGSSPAKPPAPETERVVSPFIHGVALILARFGFGLLLAAAVELPAITIVFLSGADSESISAWFARPSLTASLLAALAAMAVFPVPLAVTLEALTLRAIGRTEPGVMSRWSLAYVRVCLKTEAVHHASEWLSGTIMWPVWLRLAGASLGRGCEISTIIDSVPEMLRIGALSFLADGIYLGGPVIHRGTVTLGRTLLGDNTFVGNHAVISAGQVIPGGVLLGVCTVADENIVRQGTSWFGHPPFELPRREVVEVDRKLTYDPPLIRYLNRWFWELLRFALPVVPALAVLGWFDLIGALRANVPRAVFWFAAMPAANLAAIGSLCLLVLALKWILLGKVRPGIHPLWSCWCSRWDFLYVAWGFCASAVLSALEGTLLLPVFLRAMGAKIGKRVALGPGFAQVVDPDMLHFGDGATVNCQFQAHTFEDRVLKLDHVRIGEGATVGGGAVLLYGAGVGAGARVAPHSVVMKHETLLARHSYSGFPTQPSPRPNRASIRISGH